MPDKPTWYGRLDSIVAELQALPYPWVDRQTVETILRVRRRRAQQILQPCISQLVGKTAVAERGQFIAYLQNLASDDKAYYERQRRQRLAGTLAQLNRAAIEQPSLLVEASPRIAAADLSAMPPGVFLAPGEIRIEFAEPTEALQKLLELAMAIGNDLDTFERLTQTT